MQKNFTIKQLEVAGNKKISHKLKREERLATRESQALIEEFTQYLIENGKRPKTVESYIGDVTGFEEYIEHMRIEFSGNC